MTLQISIGDLLHRSHSVIARLILTSLFTSEVESFVEFVHSVILVS